MRACMRALVVVGLVLGIVLSPATGEEGKAGIAPLPNKVSSFGACVQDGWVYIYGGHTGKKHSYSNRDTIGKFYRVRTEGGSWEELPAGPAVQGLALVGHRGSIYRIGGMQPRNDPGEKSDNHSLRSVSRYDVKSRTWHAMPDLPEGRSSHEAVVVGDELFVVGGWNMQGSKAPTWHDKALVLNLVDSKASWRTVEQPFRRRALGAAVVDGKVYVLGGLTDRGEAVSRVDIYDPQKNTWEQGVALPAAGQHGFSPAACSDNGKLYFSGSDGVLHRLDGKTWTVVGKQSIKRMVHRLVVDSQGRVIVLGGNAPLQDAREVEVLVPRNNSTGS